jgi:hypothetical protein
MGAYDVTIVNCKTIQKCHKKYPCTMNICQKKKT